MPLSMRYWCTAVLLSVLNVFEFFDFFVVGFLVSVVSPLWRLSYEQTSIVLASSGVGWIAGAIFWGTVADKFGRKPTIIAAAIGCGVASGLVAFLPDQAWMSFSLLRAAVGFCAAGAAVIGITLIVELTPLERRATLTTAFTVPAGAGILIAAIGSSFLLPIIGWRGLAAWGFFPCLLATIAIFVVPESRLWREAQSASAGAANLPKTSPKWTSLWRPPSRFALLVGSYFFICCAMYGVVQWGPTMVTMIENGDATLGARLFIMVGVGGLIGRITFVWLVSVLGRRKSGEIMGYGAALALGAAAALHTERLFGLPAFVCFIVLAAFFYDGGVANLVPYAAELYPPALAARATGLATTSSGIAKIVGPLLVGWVAGAHGEAVTRQSTIEAITPTFLLLAATAATAGVTFTLFGIETSPSSRRQSIGVS